MEDLRKLVFVTKCPCQIVISGGCPCAIMCMLTAVSFSSLSQCRPTEKKKNTSKQRRERVSTQLISIDDTHRIQQGKLLSKQANVGWPTKHGHSCGCPGVSAASAVNLRPRLENTSMTRNLDDESRPHSTGGREPLLPKVIFDSG